jgi:hypothetical protein
VPIGGELCERALLRRCRPLRRIGPAKLGDDMSAVGDENDVAALYVVQDSAELSLELPDADGSHVE